MEMMINGINALSGWYSISTIQAVVELQEDSKTCINALSG